MDGKSTALDFGKNFIEPTRPARESKCHARTKSKMNEARDVSKI